MAASKAVDKVEAALRGDPNGRRVGQLLFGANPWLTTSMGMADVDAKAPGFGLVFGYTDPLRTGAEWSSAVVVRALSARVSVHVGSRTIMRAGRYQRD